ncbi:hypothetical protein ILYODFUR_031175 [Ilyodon furcidens]|uniref:Uncharacterized protein n=1 Tax=Ilyodon furcidens TaxID=33524 RepID=A0ABV0U238_9TELE
MYLTLSVHRRQHAHWSLFKGGFLGLNPERGTKAAKGKVTSKTTGRLVQKKQTAVNQHVSTLLCQICQITSGTFKMQPFDELLGSAAGPGSVYLIFRDVFRTHYSFSLVLFGCSRFKLADILKMYQHGSYALCM